MTKLRDLNRLARRRLSLGYRLLRSFLINIDMHLGDVALIEFQIMEDVLVLLVLLLDGVKGRLEELCVIAFKIA